MSIGGFPSVLRAGKATVNWELMQKYGTPLELMNEKKRKTKVSSIE